MLEKGKIVDCRSQCASEGSDGHKGPTPYPLPARQFLPFFREFLRLLCSSSGAYSVSLERFQSWVTWSFWRQTPPPSPKLL